LIQPNELIVDLFAGGGGASTGIETALGRVVDLAVNHDPLSIEMHLANHPGTRHFCEGVFNVDPARVCGGRPVGLLWLSPDCRHFSRAKGKAPVSPSIRALAWVGFHWAEAVRPRLIVLENVEEFQTWGPLLADNTPDPARRGETFREFRCRLQSLGYSVSWQTLNAADFGAPTSRKRLFLIARCDGEPIVWPDPTHGPGTPRPWRTAGECIDWSIPCRTIFGRERPLADATLCRIARGVVRFVLQADRPFIVNLTHGGRIESLDEPMRTVTAAHRGEKALVAAFMAKHYGGVTGHSLRRPLGTITAWDHHSLVTCALGGGNSQKAAAFLVHYYGQGTQAQSLAEPMHTIVTRARHGLVTVAIAGQEYDLVDVGMRMLEPHELAAAQGFPGSYVLTGNKSQKIARIGNAVCPPVAAAVVSAQFGKLEWESMAA